jgi:hypothetical protein
VSLRAQRIPAGAANRGQPWPQLPGQASRGARITATSSTTSEGDGHGDFPACNFTYTVVPWNPNVNESANIHNQTHLEPGDPVFVQTLVVEQFVLYNMLNAAQLNSTLRDNTVVFRARVAKNQPDAVKFNNYLRRYGENMLSVYANLRAEGRLRYLRALFGSDADIEMAALKEFHKMSTNKHYYALTRYGISQTWNFVGFVLTTSDPLRMKGIQQFGYSRVLAVNVTVKGNFEDILQLWPGPKQCPAQSHLWFVLTRLLTDRGVGPFQYYPFGSRMRESIPRSLLSYRGEDGRLCEGAAIYVGKCQLPPNRDGSDSMRMVAAGLVAETPHAQREAGAQLTRHNGQMRVQIGVF